MHSRVIAVLLLFATGAGCNDLVPKQPFCADSPAPPAGVSRAVTWHADVRPIVEARCARCHAPGEIGPFALTTYAEVFESRAIVRAAVVAGSMPPWLPAGCCNHFRDDIALTAEQIALIDAWVAQGAPEGDPAVVGAPLPVIGGLSRVDARVEMAAPYVPVPRPGHTDDYRCFVLDWPRTEGAYVTGMNPRPGARKVVHHLVVAVVSESEGLRLRKREGRDGRPGFYCEGELGKTEIQALLGGGLVGSDFPVGIGTYVGPKSKLVLNIHYSLAGSPALADRTAVEFRLDASARKAKVLPIANPLWLIGDAMRVAAGDPDAAYAFQYDPYVVTRGRTLMLRGFTPHMHALASRQKFAIVRKNPGAGGKVECVTEIPVWRFGWEQPLWFAEPIPFYEGDQLYIQCHIDNSASHQPIVDGQRTPPRDIAWGTDNQEMCAGFVTYTEGD